MRACWPAASLSGTGTGVQQTPRPSSGQWTQQQRSSVTLAPPSWICSLLDAAAKAIVLWRTPPILPTVSSSSYHQEDGNRPSEPAPPDCITTLPPPNITTSQEKNCQTCLCNSKCATHRWVGLYKPPVVTHSPLFALDTLHTLLCVHNATKDSVIYIYIYICLHAHALKTILHFSPASCLTYDVLFAHVKYLWSICTVVQFVFLVYTGYLLSFVSVTKQYYLPIRP